jgi:hypothetical protein
MIPRTPRIIRRASLDPRTADEPHRVVKPPPPQPVPALDAFTLLALWRRFRMLGDVANAARILAELERLAVRKPRAGGDRDEQFG